MSSQEALEKALSHHRESLEQLENIVQNYIQETSAETSTPAQMPMMTHNTWYMPLIEITYFVAAVLFILGLKKMSSPLNARKGIVWAGVGMVIATLATFFYPNMNNYLLIILAIILGGGAAWWTAKRVAMTDMPQMIAMYNGLGGGAAAAIAAVELLKGAEHSLSVQTLAVLGALIGCIAFSGSVIAYAKLDGILKTAVRFNNQQLINLALFIITVLIGMLVVYQGVDAHPVLIISFFILALSFGILMGLPIGGADMPVVISLFNALTGLAVALEGFVLGNAAMIIAGTVVGSAGTLLTQLMAKAMNRPISNILFKSFGATEGEAVGEVEGSMKEIEASDAAVMMAYANQVVIVPGYGMAVAQAQHKIWELSKALIERGVRVKFAIHPVAGRMPGHMNVLLAEAGVPYDLIFDMDEINAEFEQTDVAVVIGANDVVNPSARKNPESPIYGMPILNVDKAHNTIVIKRGQGKGFSGIENLLFYADNTRMLYGDGQKAAAELLQQLKEL